MAQPAKSDLNIFEKIDRLENAITAILEKLELPKLETFHDKSTKKADATTPQQPETFHDKSTKKAEEVTPQQPVEPVKIEIKPYEYEQLDPNARQIRLFELAPLDDSVDDADALTGSLKIYSLDKLQFIGRGYNALSYTWGEPVMDTKILIDGRSFLITKSLRSALARISQRKHPRTNLWWIDQICVYLVAHVSFRN
jgi:Heterokaryon incompatibility protein (HET)